jgi:mevalonate kinase
LISKAWYSHGKLLLTGEYLILEGAKALALPLKLGQYLSVKKAKEPLLKWKAMKPDGAWFQAQFSLPDLYVVKSTDDEMMNRLRDLLLKTRSLNNNFLNEEEGKEVETILEFAPEYGFGSSSTLINNVAKWAEVDPFKLLKLTFGGSGYDIACAQASSPITYSLKGESPVIEDVYFKPSFHDQLYFVYLNKKQVSRESIDDFRKKALFSKRDAINISEITDRILLAINLAEFEQLLFEHEKIIATILGRPIIKSELFYDYPGMVKSLGAWGGDFIMMTSRSEPDEFESYIKNKGFETFYRYEEIIKT